MKNLKSKILILLCAFACNKPSLTFKVSPPCTTTLSINGSQRQISAAYEFSLTKGTTIATADTCRYEIKENGIIIMNCDATNYTFKNKRSITN